MKCQNCFHGKIRKLFQNDVCKILLPVPANGSTLKGKKFLPLTMRGHVLYHILEEFKQIYPL